jgi:hypothetical protein
MNNLLSNIELPTIKVSATIDRDSLINIGLLASVVGVSLIAFYFVLKNLSTK